MPVNAAPAANLVVVHAELLFGRAETGFDRPAAKGHTQQPTQCHTSATNHSMAQEVFDLARAHIPSHD
jgi:hypothetical protein